MLVDDLRSCFPDYNIMVMHDEQPYEWVSQPTFLVRASSYTMQETVEAAEMTIAVGLARYRLARRRLWLLLAVGQLATAVG